MNAKFKRSAFEALPVVGILRGMQADIMLKIAELYFKSGYTTLEITMNTAGATDTIHSLVKAFPAMNIGAGTVCTKTDLTAALDAGASFIVTPIVDVEIIKTCVTNSLPVFPGALTPTEIYQAWSAGATAVKLFPASQFGPSYLREVLAPLNQIKILPTGGISADNVVEYLQSGAYGLGVGSGLFVKEFIAKKDFNSLEKGFQRFKNQIREFRNIE